MHIIHIESAEQLCFQLAFICKSKNEKIQNGILNQQQLASHLSKLKVKSQYESSWVLDPLLKKAILSFQQH
jgi:hypothetical protein